MTVFPKVGVSFQPELPGGNDPLSAFTAELQEAVDGVRSNAEPAWLGGQLARDALMLCHKECESVRTGKIVEC